MNYGNQNAKQKLTCDDVKLIRDLCAERKRLLDEASKITNKSIADKFGVHPNYIDRIWRHEARTV